MVISSQCRKNCENCALIKIKGISENMNLIALTLTLLVRIYRRAQRISKTLNIITGFQVDFVSFKILFECTLFLKEYRSDIRDSNNFVSSLVFTKK